MDRNWGVINQERTKLARLGEAWQERLAMTLIGVGAVITLAWCATIVGIAAWLMGRLVS